MEQIIRARFCKFLNIYHAVQLFYHVGFLLQLTVSGPLGGLGVLVLGRAAEDNKQNPVQKGLRKIL